MTADVPTPTDVDVDTAPNVFISYSHDSEEHKAWVANLAARLRVDGIDVRLDQWDLSLGGDVSLFMDELDAASRVLCICTAEYVRRANAGVGGVGYERQIVTKELMRTIDTNKFIPVVRQPDGGNALPKFLASRLYVNLSDDPIREDAYQQLLRELHGEPPRQLHMEVAETPSQTSSFARCHLFEQSLGESEGAQFRARQLTDAAQHPSRQLDSIASLITPDSTNELGCLPG